MKRRPPALAAPLLAWFAKSRRDLPWRTPAGVARDPYRTWLSEVMLQQTRVEVVLPYWARFIGRFPTLEALAQAPLDEVLALWSGLGYYARARNLHRAAQAAAARGGFPRSAAGLRELPGFGPYTAAAVASLAFGEDVALVDGNVARVLARVLRLPGDPARVRARAWELAPELLPRGRAGEFNEALMELGATVCTPRAPRCGQCPLHASCAARAAGCPERHPAPRPRRARPRLVWTALALTRKDGAVLLWRRPAGSLFAGLWDLPPQAELRGVRTTGLRDAGVVAQTLTHREVEVSLRVGRTAGTMRRADLRWARPDELAALGLSSLARKLLAAASAAKPPTPVRAARKRHLPSP